MTEKSYRKIPIHENGERLIPIPNGIFILTDPHPYLAVGAPYGAASPWMLRESVLQALVTAQNALRARHTGYTIRLHDAYRPTSVQTFMVQREYELCAARAGFDSKNLTPEQREHLTPEVLRIWAIPSEDPATPPPHSTGAVVDVTLTDEMGHDLFMGGELDENSLRALPDHYAHDPSPKGQEAHANRTLLNAVMESAGFIRNPIEWWHFSKGDQMWAEVQRKRTGDMTLAARYSGVRL